MYKIRIFFVNGDLFLFFLLFLLTPSPVAYGREYNPLPLILFLIVFNILYIFEFPDLPLLFFSPSSPLSFRFHIRVKTESADFAPQWLSRELTLLHYELHY